MPLNHGPQLSDLSALNPLQPILHPLLHLSQHNLTTIDPLPPVSPPYLSLRIYTGDHLSSARLGRPFRLSFLLVPTLHYKKQGTWGLHFFPFILGGFLWPRVLMFSGPQPVSRTSMEKVYFVAQAVPDSRIIANYRGYPHSVCFCCLLCLFDSWSVIQIYISIVSWNASAHPLPSCKRCVDADQDLRVARQPPAAAKARQEGCACHGASSTPPS